MLTDYVRFDFANTLCYNLDVVLASHAHGWCLRFCRHLHVLDMVLFLLDLASFLNFLGGGSIKLLLFSFRWLYVLLSLVLLSNVALHGCFCFSSFTLLCILDSNESTFSYKCGCCSCVIEY